MQFPGLGALAGLSQKSRPFRPGQADDEGRAGKRIASRIPIGPKARR